jgi:phenylpyruvate tautomerase PptA (4-oxalocrotonate tautomerase family)
MPIVFIKSAKSVTRVPELLEDVRNSAAAALGCEPSNVWPVLEPVAPGPFPPIVLIKANVGRTIEQRRHFASAVADAVGRGLGVPADEVWIHYEEMQPRDIWHKGNWSP